MFTGCEDGEAAAPTCILHPPVAREKDLAHHRKNPRFEQVRGGSPIQPHRGLIQHDVAADTEERVVFLGYVQGSPGAASAV
ncbi:hypothetical protein predicted by Glimmer/Critica [Sorangium cellulosum So ce56]|uniref:Uncharacterized protein n=1 Tax=Sorangium cellulosum (strain So ce56) TaxID=448385 RepID=A9GP44_SORC5|nr:hypothetical protein predicted by Glimmer/Critica [Sorangium cellulosum So ce56]